LSASVFGALYITTYVLSVLASINWNLNVGSWEIDLRDGEVRFKINILYEGVDLDDSPTLPEYTRASISIGLKTFQQGRVIYVLADG